MSQAPVIVVIGSANRDLVVRTERIPAPGETAMGSGFVTAPGGKGANQAVAAARLGADVWFVGRIGRDAFGDSLTGELDAVGIHTEFLIRDEAEPTGVALIGVDAAGQNSIIVAPGANSRLSRNDVDRAGDRIAAAYAIIVQLEIPLDTVDYAVKTARTVGAFVVLNPAPVRTASTLSDALLAQVDVLIPNEHEALQLLGLDNRQGLSWEKIAQRLMAKGPRGVVITLGEAGCVLADSTGTRAISAPVVRPVDTTAAGDCFTGGLTTALGQGYSLDEAARFASRAAAISVTRNGAQPSLPTRAEVDSYVF